MVAKITIGKPVHEAVSQRIQPLVSAQLWNTGSAATSGSSKRCYRDSDRSGQCPGLIGEIQVGKLPQLQIVSSKINKEPRRACRWRSSTINIRGQDAAKRCAQLETDLGGGGASQHGGAIKGAELGTGKGLAIIKDVVSNQVCVVPDTQLGIVNELDRAVVKGIDVVCAGSIRSLRHGHALPVSLAAAAGHRKLGQDPAVCQFVILGDGVAVVM